MKNNSRSTETVKSNQTTVSVMGVSTEKALRSRAWMSVRSRTPGCFRVRPRRGVSLDTERAAELHGTDVFESRSMLTLYLREIGPIKLLTREEEIDLARRAQHGDDAARELMIKSNLRLVVKIARDYEGFGLPLLDLISEGNIGLMKAVERFDPDRGAKFSVYSSFWIKQGIRRALANSAKTVRLPVHAQEKLLRIHRASAKLQEVLGHEPSDEELSVEVGLPAAKVRKLRTAVQAPLPLDGALDERDDRSIAETVADESAHTAFQELDAKGQADLLREFLPQLADREREVLRLRFGLDGESERTLDEAGSALGLTRERIRQIQNQALQRLRLMMQEREAIQLAA
jgi:RNA polymerase primary sigma factor